jgi:signal transduction histidine kinase/ligand-binding sensor domain-containing protein
MLSTKQINTFLFINASVLVFIFLLLHKSASAQQYEIRSFSNEEGLKSEKMICIEKDPYGFLWIGTQAGLYRYDGHEFEEFKANTNGIAVSGIYANDLVMQDSLLYIMWWNADVDVVNTRTLNIVRRIKFDKSILVYFLTTINRTIYAGTTNGFYKMTPSGTLQVINKELSALACDFYFPFDSTLLRIKLQDNSCVLFDASKNKLIALKNKCFYNIGSLVKYKNFYIFENSKGVYALPVLDLYKSEAVPKLIKANTKFQKIHVTDTTLFIFDELGVSKAVLLNQKFTCSRVLEEAFVPIAKLHSDNAGNTWCLSEGPLYKFSKKQNIFEAYTPLNKEKDFNFYGLYSDSTNELLGAGRGGFYKANTQKQLIRNKQSESFLGTHFIYKIDNHKFLVGSDVGFKVYNALTDHFNDINNNSEVKCLKPLSNNEFNKVLQINDSLVAMGAENEEGLFLWNTKKESYQQFSNDTKYTIPETHILDITKTTNGQIAFASDKSIYTFNPFTFKTQDILASYHLSDKVNCNIFFCIKDLPHKIVASSYNNGVLIINKKDSTHYIINETNGLSNNSTYRIELESDSVIWVSTNNGLNRININTYQVNKYFKEDGLHGNIFEQCSSMSANGSLYFGGYHGITKVNVRQPVSKSICPIIIKRFKYFNNYKDTTIRILKLAAMALGTNPFPICISITNLDYSNSTANTFYYKINNGAWLLVPDNNEIIIDNLNAGQYALSFKQINLEQKELIQEDVFQFSIQQYWYKSWWFFTLLTLLILLNIYWINNLVKKRKSIAQQKELEKTLALSEQRNQFRADLHDDIGSQLGSLKLMSKLLLKNDANMENIQKQFVNEIDNLSHGIKETMWLNNTAQATIEELGLYIHKTALDFCRPAELSLQFSNEFAHPDLVLSTTQRKHVSLICREALHNLIKYAQATRVILSIQEVHQQLRIIIHDNGIGLPLHFIAGNGIASMQQRAKQINASIHFTNEVGLKIVLTLTLN